MKDAIKKHRFVALASTLVLMVNTVAPAFGQVSRTYERVSLPSTYYVNYTYDDVGNRATVSYTTPSTSTNSLPDVRYAYSDYLRVGSPDSPAYVFQTLTKLTYESSTWKTTYVPKNPAGSIILRKCSFEVVWEAAYYQRFT